VKEDRFIETLSAYMIKRYALCGEQKQITIGQSIFVATKR
jgi:hypothetical protein